MASVFNGAVFNGAIFNAGAFLAGLFADDLCPDALGNRGAYPVPCSRATAAVTAGGARICRAVHSLR